MPKATCSPSPTLLMGWDFFHLFFKLSTKLCCRGANYNNRVFFLFNLFPCSSRSTFYPYKIFSDFHLLLSFVSNAVTTYDYDEEIMIHAVKTVNPLSISSTPVVVPKHALTPLTIPSHRPHHSYYSCPLPSLTLPLARAPLSHVTCPHPLSL